jgi:hypothetical protein
MFGFFVKRSPQSIEMLKIPLHRDELIKRSRILFIDDERPELIDDLKKSRFSVDYESDITPENIQLLDNPVHDLFIVDFVGVGKLLGKDQGLTILRHIKRVNPTSVTIAYTSKSVKAEHADFYKLADAVLQKDAGIGESTEKIEHALRMSYRVDRLWSGVLEVASVPAGSEQDRKLQDRFMVSLGKKKTDEFKKEYASICRDVGSAVGTIVLERLIKVAITGEIE